MVSRGMWVVAGIVVSVASVLTLMFLFAEAWGLTDERWIRDSLASISERDHGRLLAGALIGALLAADLFLPVPSSILMTLSGYLCGFAIGTAISFAGAMASAWIGFAACRRWGRGAFRRLVGDVDLPRLERIQEKYGAGGLLLSRSVPMLTELVSCLAGLSAMSQRRFLALSAAGTLPICAVYAWAGDRSRGDASLAWPIALAFLLPAVGYLVIWKLQRRSATARDDLGRQPDE